MFKPTSQIGIDLFIWALAFFGATIAAGSPCEALLMQRTEERVFFETMKTYEKAQDLFFQKPFEELLISAGKESVDYYQARYVAYRLILDSNGFVSQLRKRYLILKNSGYGEPYGRFIDLAHGRLTNHVLRRAKVSPITEAEVTAVLDEVVQILRS